MQNPSNKSQIRRWWLVLFAAILTTAVWLTRPPVNSPKEPIPSISPGFQRSCVVTRDKFQIPHISAQTQEAALYCWGRIHAQDRGWQLDHLRRLAYGRVAETHGSAFAQQDFFLRIVDLASIAHQWATHMRQHQPHRYRLFQFYIWGINDGLKTFQQQKPKHYVLATTGQSIAPWRLEHSLSLLLLQGLQMTSMSFSKDIKHARYRLALGEKRYHELYGPDRGHNPLDHPILHTGEHPLLPTTQVHPPSPRSPSSTPQPRKQGLFYPIPPQQKLTQTHSSPQHKAQKLAALSRWLHQLPSFIPTESGGFGSNSWVVAPTRSASGYPLLANDTHMPITTPNFWHEAHIRAQNIDCSGFAVPGLPSILIGHNRHLAWGLTAGQNNSADVVEATQNSDGSLQIGKQRLPVTTFRPIVSIKAGPFYLPVFWKTFRRTQLGPILPIPWPGNKVLLLRWTPFHINKPPLALIELMTQQHVAQADKLLQTMTFPNLNIITADIHGNIGYRQFGLIPKRLTGVNGLLDPNQPGASWNGFLDHNEQPHLLRIAQRCKTSAPPSSLSAYEQAICRRGFVVTANNRPFPHTYPFFLGHGFDKGLRAKKIEDLLSARPSHHLEDMKHIQLDVSVAAAHMLLPEMLRLIQSQSKSLPPLEQKALNLLRSWHRKAYKHLVEPTLFRTWLEFTRQRMFARDVVTLDKGEKQYPGRLGLWRGLFGKIPLGSSLSSPEILRLALQDTILRLTRLYGKNITSWTWGRMNQVAFHSMIGPKARWTPGSHAKDGDIDSVNVAHHDRKPGPYHVQYAASIRLVIELGPRIRSHAVLAGQQIDHNPRQLSPEHKRWLEHQYRTRLYYPDEIKTSVLSQQTFSF